jgi:hypothetical protein
MYGSMGFRNADMLLPVGWAHFLEHTTRSADSLSGMPQILRIRHINCSFSFCSCVTFSSPKKCTQTRCISPMVRTVREQDESNLFPVVLPHLSGGRRHIPLLTPAQPFPFALEMVPLPSALFGNTRSLLSSTKMSFDGQALTRGRGMKSVQRDELARRSCN